MVGAVHTPGCWVLGKDTPGVTELKRSSNRARVAAQPHPSSQSLFLPGIAKACEQNLRKTLQFGGRSLFPSSMELKAMVVRPGARGCLWGGTGLVSAWDHP